jgi:diadenylate cyclase
MPPLELFREMLTWRAMLDIALIAAGMFLLYRTLLRLGTWKIVTGLLLAGAIFLVANLLDLTGIEWIYTNVSHVAVIALIVIFQPELRKLFERAASVRRSDAGDRTADLSGMIAEALFALARKKWGAIIVFPGKESLRAWVSGGFDLDAEPSFPLIMSIFDPSSPGHDGAVIIKNGRMTRFGVRLPVSRSARLSEDFGTRHHAALGLAEVADALICLVSEERGGVVLFQQGRWTPIQDKSDIVSAIRAHWQATAAHPFEVHKGLPKWVLAPQMIASLLLAGLLWSVLMFAQGEMLEKMVTVPVEYAASPPNLALVGDKQNEIKLHLYGPKPDLDALNPAELNIRIDLSRAVAGSQSFFITEDSIRLPRRVKLLDAAPATLKLTLAEIIERELPVKPQLVGALPGGLQVRSIHVSPPTVRATAPAATTRSEALSITTTPIYLGTIREDTEILCKIIAPPNIQPADRRWPDVEVRIRVAPRP